VHWQLPAETLPDSLRSSVRDKIGGEVVFDATQRADRENGSRDRKMHRDVLENRALSGDHVPPRSGGGKGRDGGSLYGAGPWLFGIHGAEHEIVVPVEVNLKRRPRDRVLAVSCALREMGHEESSVPVSPSGRLGRT